MSRIRGFLVLPLLLCASPRVFAADSSNLDRSLRTEARYGRIGRIEGLVRRGANVNGRAEYGETALYYSVLFGRVKASLRLLELGAEPDDADELDRTPLLKAAEDCNFRVVDALLKAGARVNHADYFGRTALINAAESGCVRAVAVLLRRGGERIELEARDGSFRNALDYAGHPWIEAMLRAARDRRGGARPAPGRGILP